MTKYFFVSYVFTGKTFGFGNCTTVVEDRPIFNHLKFIEDMKPLEVKIISFQEMTKEESDYFNESINH